MGKIFIGEWNTEEIVRNYCNTNPIDKVYVIGNDLSLDGLNFECIKFADTIMYKYFYRLLQSINKNSLIVLNQCLRKQNRYDLTYNCIRRYCLQTQHRLIFNYFPIIKEQKDFMILYDMIQNNPFLKESYKYITKFNNVEIGPIQFIIKKTDVIEPAEILEKYEKEKELIISQVKKDPDIIPRRLLKFSEKHKDKGYDKMNVIKPIMNIELSNLKVDQYYYNELLKFKEELSNALQRIHQ